MLYTSVFKSHLGDITLACDEEFLVGLWFEGQKYFGSTLHTDAETNDNLPLVLLVKDRLRRYFAGEKPDFKEIPIAPSGSSFRKAVWEVLCEIPYGSTVTYGMIAKKFATMLGKKSMSSQAVGNAVGHNPISVIIPCHRVVGTGGSLTGYAGGVARKLELLRLEGADMRGLYVPKTGTAL
ncbi:MAG: methylated-DNA--[protein]-cysteine S-methyltransferase [Ruminococcaceae bacterium]|nr:methylated-DNA--[protein]-cysteine S-methyltransferase [Oscillospiraceae bacterium]